MGRSRPNSTKLATLPEELRDLLVPAISSAANPNPISPPMLNTSPPPCPAE